MIKDKTIKQIIGTCRLRFINNKAKLERMAIKKEYRKQGLGSALINKIFEFSKEKKLKEIYLHSQLKAKEFYLSNGFEVISEATFQEAGIEHIKMNKKIRL